LGVTRSFVVYALLALTICLAAIALAFSNDLFDRSATVLGQDLVPWAYSLSIGTLCILSVGLAFALWTHPLREVRPALAGAKEAAVMNWNSVATTTPRKVTINAF
jgi:hypothetical protein